MQNKQNKKNGYGSVGKVWGGVRSSNWLMGMWGFIIIGLHFQFSVEFLEW